MTRRKKEIYYWWSMAAWLIDFIATYTWCASGNITAFELTTLFWLFIVATLNALLATFIFIKD